MRFGSTLRHSLLLLLLVGPAVQQAAAQQTTPCSYDSCALRLRFRGAGDRKIVQGSAGLPADDGGFWSKNVPVLAAGSDSVRFHYVEYRSHATRSGWIGIFGAAAVGAAASMNFDDNKTAAISLYSGGFILGIISAVNHSRSEEHLSRAIWLYNRDLAR